MFSMMESKPHAVQKRMLSNVYSKSYLQSSLDLAISSKSIVFGRLLPILESLTVQNERVDVHELNFAVAIDFITSYVFGSYNGTNFLEDTKTRKEWLHQYHCRAPYKFWPAEFPKMAPFLRKFKMNLVPRFVDVANEIIEAWCMEMCNATKLSLSKSSQQAHSETLSTSPIVYKQLLGSFLASAQKVELSTSQNFKVASEILDQLGAGFETTGITLTYYIYELSKHPDIQASIRTELLSLSPDLQYPSVDSSLPSPRSIDGLALLDATLMETLRLHAAIPGPQPRKTPSTPTSLVGSPPLPAGIRVSANPHCLHRNKDVFPDPETWRPERWLTDDQASKNEMMRWFWAFGSGSRKCIGSHFATQGMYTHSIWK